MSALLLDTQVLLWWWAADARLADKVHRSIDDPTSTIHVSAATIWEIVVKTAKGRLETARPIDETLLDSLSADRMRPLAILPVHVLALRSLPAIHNDPFDRILLAQALAEGLTLVTADRTLMRYGVACLPAAD